MKHRTILLLCTIGMLGACGAAVHAQDTIVVYGDVGGGLHRYIDTPSGTTTFDVVAVAEIAQDAAVAQFKLTPLNVEYPGVFMVATTYPGVAQSLLDRGEYSLFFSWGGLPCLETGVREFVRVTYLDLEGILGSNIVVAPTHYEPDDLSVHDCNEFMCYLNCPLDGQRYPLTPVPWVDYDVIDPLWIPGVESSDGVLVLNPNPMAVNGEATSMGCLKARF